MAPIPTPAPMPPTPDNDSFLEAPLDRCDVLTNIAYPGPKSHHKTFANAAVAADTEISSTVAKKILKQGGSVVDATVAAMTCTGVINPQHSGIGGSLFMLVHAVANGETEMRTHCIDGRTTTPAAGTKEFYGSDYMLKRRGVFSIGLPGEIKALYEAWQKFGKLPWRDLIQPAIDICTEGYHMRPTTSGRFATHWADMLSWSNMRHDDKAWKELFTRLDGSMFKTGEKMTNLRLAQTLERIADDPMSFYTGKLAEEIVADLNDHQGHITIEDLRNYQVNWPEPYETELHTKGTKLVTMPPPSSGAVLLFIIKLYEKFKHTPADMETVEGATLAYHHLMECMKFGFAEKTRIADPKFSERTKEVMETICTDKFIDSIYSQIDNDKTHESIYYNPSVGKSKDGGTTHLSIVAEDGSAVACTGTLNGIFGSYVRGKRTGIIFNNENGTFSAPNPPDSEGYLEPPEFNFFAPYKRPRSSKSPLMCFDEAGQVRLVIGGSGGRRITTATAFVLAHHLFLGQSIQKSIDLPRFAHFLSPNTFEYEAGFHEEIVEGLRRIGHVGNQAIPVPQTPEELRAQLANKQKPCISVVQAIANVCESKNHFGENGSKKCSCACLKTVADCRKGGIPDGW